MLKWWESMQQMRAERQAARGAAYLDRAYGPQWRGSIDTRRLDISSNSDCIVGQLSKVFGTGTRLFYLSLIAGVGRGTQVMTSRHGARLTKAWLGQLQGA